MSEDHEKPHLGEVGEHPLSVLLFSWMRGKLFLRVFAMALAIVGVASIGLEFWLSHKPIKDVTSVPGFYAVFGFIASAMRCGSRVSTQENCKPKFWRILSKRR